MRQLDLFDQTREREDAAMDRGLAEQLPSGVYLGTSSWTFPGWAGLIYPTGTTQRLLEQRGLELYTQHPLLRTVGIDRSYYSPLDAPTLTRYAGQLPEGFVATQKVFSRITIGRDPRTGSKNPDFLNADLFQQRVLAPNQQAFAEHMGPLIFQFPPMRGRDRPSPAAFAAQLDDFFERLPTSANYAVELRNVEYLCPEYVSTLARHRVAHVFNFWEAMPPIRAQLEIPDIAETAAFVVARLLLPPGRRFQDRQRALHPFAELKDPQPEMRADCVSLLNRALGAARPGFVIVNNKAEGCAPLTVRAIAKALVSSLQDRTHE
jgi:uncharacterized protein YecE (DUF72 family)